MPNHRSTDTSRENAKQTLVRVVCTRGPSLREAIVKHKRIEHFDLRVTFKKRQGRRNGWAKVHSVGRE